MDLNRIYNNPGLEARRLALLKRMQAEEVLRDSHEAGSIARQIELGFHSFNKLSHRRDPHVCRAAARRPGHAALRRQLRAHPRPRQRGDFLAQAGQRLSPMR